MPRPAVLDLTLVTLTVAAAGCGGSVTSPDRVRLATDRAAYAAQDTVAVTVTNAGTAELTFGVCASALERRVGGGWQSTVRLPANGLCNAVALSAASGGAAAFRVVLPSGLAPGEYRWRFRDLGDRRTSGFQLR